MTYKVTEEGNIALFFKWRDEHGVTEQAKEEFFL